MSDEITLTKLRMRQDATDVDVAILTDQKYNECNILFKKPDKKEDD